MDREDRKRISDLTRQRIACCGRLATKRKSPTSFRKLKIEGKGEFENVRLEARPASVKRAGNWMWENNPFMNTPEFRGLKILMVMLNNWDMKDDNNEILAMRGDTTGEGELRYIISDLGGYIRKDRRVLLAQSQRAVMIM